MLFLVFIVFFGLVGYFLSFYFDNSSLLIIAIFYSLITSFISYWFSDKIVLSMSKAKLIEKKDNKELYNLVENLCITVGLPTPKIYLMTEESPNAFATGRNPKNSAICVTTGLLSMLDKSELEGVIAHELSHIKNYDILIATIVIVLASSLTFISNMILRTRLWVHSDNDDKSGASLLYVIAFVLIIILSPIVGMLIQLAISRKREFLADASGALITRYPDGLISALKKISSSDIQMRNTNDLTRNLFIIDPLKKKVSWFSKIWLTHPPLEERVKALELIKKP